MPFSLPLTPAVIADVAAHIRSEDMAHADATEQVLQIGSNCVLVLMLEAETDVPVAFTRNPMFIPIILDNDAFAQGHTDHLTRPEAATILTTEGEIVLICNSTLLEMRDDEINVEIAEGILAHEIGHILAGHLRNPPAGQRLDNYPADGPEPEDSDAYWQALSRSLLTGGIIPKELEADRYAMALAGSASILAVLAYHAAKAETYGARLEFQNRIDRHVRELTVNPDYIPELDVEFGIIDPTDL
jgi:hypothetical protein